MSAIVEIDQKSLLNAKYVIEEFARLSGKSIEEGVQMMARAAARRLANNIHPFGMDQKIGADFQKSIGGQVVRAIQYANVNGMQGTAAEVHQRLRKFGRVPDNLAAQGQFRRDPITIAEREKLATQKKRLAGQAKGSWIKAGDSVSKTKISKVPRWVSRHRKSGYGSAIMSGEGINHTIILENRTPYLRFIQPDKMIAEASAFGIYNGTKSMEKAIKRLTAKANRELK